MYLDEKLGCLQSKLRSSGRVGSENHVAGGRMAYEDSSHGDTGSRSYLGQSLSWLGEVRECVRFTLVRCGGVWFSCTICYGCHGYAHVTSPNL